MPDRSTIHKNLSLWMMLLLAFFLPLSKAAVPLIIVLMVLNWIVEGRFTDKITRLKSNKLYVGLFVSFYLIHQIGMLYSSNTDFGFFDLEIKMSVFVFPILFGSSIPVSKTQIKRILNTFILGSSLKISAVGNCRSLNQHNIIFCRTNDTEANRRF